MKNTTRSYLMIAVACSLVVGCGFKSDLFIPGEPKSLGQVDSSSIESLKQKTLDELQSQDTEIFRTLSPDEVINIQTTLPELPENGVPIEIVPLTQEEINKIREKK